MPDGDLQIQYDEEGNLLLNRPTARPASVPAGPHFSNLSVDMQSGDLDMMCTTLTEMVSNDEHSRTEWEEINAEAWELLGVGPEAEPDDVDDDSSDTSNSTLMLQALTRFMSKSMSSLMPSPNEAVNYDLAFDPNSIEDKEERRQAIQRAHEAGRRVQRFYTDYFFRRLSSYVEDTEQLLMEMGLNGLGIRKIFTDTTRDPKVQSIFVPASDLVISYDAKNFRTGRITHRMDMPTPDLIRMIQSNQYRAVTGLTDGSVPQKDRITEQKDRIVGLSRSYMEGTETHRLYEIHCELFLDIDPHPLGLARPYIVTIHQRSMEVLSIVRNWRPNDPTEQRIEHFVGYLFFPGKSAVYGMGIGHLLANTTRSLRTAQRRGLEAAYLQNHPSGFKLSNFKVRDDSTKIRSGEFIDVDSPTGDIRSALMMHIFQGPSQGLIQLADHIESNGKQLGGLATQDLDNLMKAGMAAAPAMAAYEENTEFQSSIHARLYRANATEMTLIHERHREIYGARPIPFGSNEVLHEGDLLLVNIKPKMIPGQASKAKAVMEAQATLELSEKMPGVIDRRQASLDFLRAIGKPNIDDLILPDPAENPPMPADPVMEYMRVMQGQPIRAGIAQNHMAHIDAHAAQMRGLQTSQLPVEQGEAMMSVLAAHIAEHYAMDTLQKVAASVGIPPEMFQNGIPPEIEAQVAPQIAAAIKQIEAERAPPEGQQESRLAIEQFKQAATAQRETMKQRHEREMAELKGKQALELQRQKDEAAMERAVQDDETALEIAAMPDRNKAPARAGGIGG